MNKNPSTAVIGYTIGLLKSSADSFPIGAQIAVNKPVATQTVQIIPGYVFLVDDEMFLYIHRNCRFTRDWSPGWPPRLSHSS